MAGKYFGTDGIRGRANRPPITADIALKVGMASGLVFKHGDHRHRVVIGKDTRLSSYMIENALTAGFLAVGIDVLLTGPVPTPGIAMLTRSMRCDLGVMISASHNPYDDNGIKLFGAGRRQAVGSDRGRDRGTDRRGSRQPACRADPARPRPPHRRRDRPLYRICQAHSAARPVARGAAEWWSIAPTAPAIESRPRRCGSSAPRCFRSASIPTASTSIAMSARRRRKRSRRRCTRCAPILASRSTATPTALSLSTSGAGSSTATR